MNGKQLRNSILQMAIEGKLVAQDAADEPAVELLKRIKAEKLRMVKEGRLKKKDLDVSPVTEEEMPFEIPGNWCWCRLGELAIVARGGSPRPIKEYLTDKPNGLNWIKIGDTEIGGKYINSTAEKIKPEGLHKTRKVYPGDFLLTNSMSFGRPYITNIEGCIHDGWLVISLLCDSYDSDFLYYLLSSAFAKQQLGSKVAGAVVSNLNSDKVSESCFPLPPLEEQRRIVAKIEELMPLVDEYDKAQGRLDELNGGLAERLRKSVLQEAIQGRLVEQSDDDEPASELLKRIRAEKVRMVKEGKLKKKDLEVAAISEEEIPFEIPGNWCWCRISELALLYTGNSISESEKISKYTNVCGQVYIGTKDVQFNHSVDYNNGIHIPEKYINNFRQAPKDSILMCIEGGSAGRKIALIDRDVCFGNKLCCFECNNNITKYLYYFLQSSLFFEVFTDNKNGIIGGVSVNKLKELLIPLPPLAEQKRIVEKVEELFGVIGR